MPKYHCLIERPIQTARPNQGSNTINMLDLSYWNRCVDTSRSNTKAMNSRFL
jgi:hypothetical protein